MTNLVEKTLQQARQGSVAAIIQILNEQLADAGVRVRAVLEHKVLKLLCEASFSEQLEQQQLVIRIKEILEAIAPRHFKRVEIYSRIAKEKQSLWLEEISKDPEKELLWSQIITLKRPFFRRNQTVKTEQKPVYFPKPISLNSAPVSKRHKHKPLPWTQWLVGVSIPLVAIASLIFINQQFQGKSTVKSANYVVNKVQGQAQQAETTNVNQNDPFVEAVRLANQANSGSNTATTYSEWLDLANRWQQASDLMKTVTPNHPRYTEAQERVLSYRYNSEIALNRAKSLSQ